MLKLPQINEPRCKQLKFALMYHFFCPNFIKLTFWGNLVLGINAQTIIVKKSSTYLIASWSICTNTDAKRDH